MERIKRRVKHIQIHTHMGHDHMNTRRNPCNDNLLLLFVALQLSKSYMTTKYYVSINILSHIAANNLYTSH